MPPVLPVSNLDANQVLTHAFDEASQRLRVDALATLVDAEISVELTPPDDGVHIGDKNSGEVATVDSNGDLHVKDTEANNKLQSIDSKLPSSIGQKTSANSLSVVLASDQVVEVNLDSSTDSVAIADSTGDELNINTDGSINVKEIKRTIKNYYSEVTGIGTGITTLVVSHLATANNFLQKVEFSGTNIAEYELVVNGITQDKKRTYFGGNLNGSFDFNEGINVPTGQLIEIYAVHNRPSLGDFNARIQIAED